MLEKIKVNLSEEIVAEEREIGNRLIRVEDVQKILYASWHHNYCDANDVKVYVFGSDEPVPFDVAQDTLDWLYSRSRWGFGM